MQSDAPNHFQRMCLALYTGPFSLTKKILIYFGIPTAVVAMLIGPITPGTSPINTGGFVEGTLMLIPVAYVLSLCLVVLIDSMIVWIGRVFRHFQNKSDGHRPSVQ
jgi:membrane protein DedA with SNARE-associated domain